MRISDWSSDVCSSDLQMMRAELEPLGFKVEWKPMRDTGRAGHLIATNAGKPDTKRLLLIAHLDTVFEPDSPFQRFERMGDKAKGPGVGDDQGGMGGSHAVRRTKDGRAPGRERG